MKKIILLFVCCFAMAAQAQDTAQAEPSGQTCNECTSNIKESFDYCYYNKQIDGYCAQFNEKDNFFYLVKKGKAKKVFYDAKPNFDTFVRLAKSKKLKLKAIEILFLQEALAKWEVEKRKLGFEFMKNGLGIKITQEGDGEKPVSGQKVVAHYTGYLLDGTKFDSSKDRNQPFEFYIGQGRVIAGWDQGFAEMKKGTKAVLYIPSALAYGNRGAGRAIPPNSDLIFEVELLDIVSQ